MEGLFGSDFAIDLTPKNSIKRLVNKITSITTIGDTATDAEITKALKSSRLSIHDQLTIINDRVLKTLGKQKDNVLVIRTRQELDSYIDRVISTGFVAVDTETNNSLDPVTCKLMGLCLYAPGEKQVYVPVNHVDYTTGIRLDVQLNEQDCHDALQKIIDSGIYVIMHNGKFDYEVLKVTCGVEIRPDWDTIIAARLLDENEPAGLKDQYVKKIDPSQEKYDITKLFVKIPYAYVDPDIFALYAATDSLMTYKLYEWQYPIMTAKSNERLYWVFMNIEMPIVVVTAEMELRGVSIDVPFGEKLRLKYNKLLSDVDEAIAAELEKLKPVIQKWRITAPKQTEEPVKSKGKRTSAKQDLDSHAANVKSKTYAPKKTKKTAEQIEKEFPYVDDDGKRYKLGKTKSELLEDPINLASPAQLAILLYDVLLLPAVSKKAPRGTGEDELKALSKLIEEKTDRATGKYIGNEIYELPLCDLILERRGIVKLITSYIDTIPTLAQHWPDKRIRFHLNSLGTDTGRYSSGGKIKYMDEDNNPVEVSGINIQNIPSHRDEIRLLFMAQTNYHDRELTGDGILELPEIDEIETTAGWKFAGDLNAGDIISTEEGEQVTINNIIKKGTTYLVYFNLEQKNQC